MSKKINLSLLTIALVAFIGINTVSAQKVFKGIITYTIDYSGEIDAATKAQQPMEMTLKVLGNKSKSEINQGGGMVTMNQIVNGDDGTQILLFDVMGQKIFCKLSKENVEEDMNEEDYVAPKVTITEETKEICGYTAKKAEYIVTDEYGDEKTIIVWFSEELGTTDLNHGGQFQNLPGIPLEYTIETEGIITKFFASEIKKGKVKSTDFLIPDDYEETTFEELKTMFGG